jgi:hypothetical protein
MHMLDVRADRPVRVSSGQNLTLKVHALPLYLGFTGYNSTIAELTLLQLGKYINERITFIDAKLPAAG